MDAEHRASLEGKGRLSVTTIVDMGFTYEDTLRSVNDLMHQGYPLSFQGWESDAEPLARMPRVALEALLKVEKYFRQHKQRNAIINAQRRGKKFGRPPRKAPKGYEKQKQRYLAHELSGVKAAKACDMPYSSFMRRVRKEVAAQKEKAASAVPLPAPLES